MALMRDGEEAITFDGDAEAGAVMLVDETLSWSELAAVVDGLAWRAARLNPVAVQPISVWECTRTPCVTGCARWPRSPTWHWTTPESGWP